MKKLMFLTVLFAAITLGFAGCVDSEPIETEDTEISTEDESDGDEQDKEDDGGNVNPDVPEGFVDEPDDSAADQVGTFDYSVLSKAGHPRLLTDSEGFKTLKRKVTTEKFANKTLYKLHNEVISHAKKIITANRTFEKAADHYIIVDNLLYCAYAYKMTGQSAYLVKAKADLNKVCSFTGWNPTGLSVGEISLAVALAYDWLYYDLTLEERKLAHGAMIKNGINPMYNKSGLSLGNWNSICYGGVAMASLAVYEKDKAYAVRQIEKAYRDNLRGVSGIYSPDGNYGEGIGYWEYGGGYQVCFLDALESIFGHTGGIKETPGFMESGEYALFMHGTMNTTFSYSDGGSTADKPLLTSWWYAARKDDSSLILCEKRHLDNGAYSEISLDVENFRLLPAILVMIREFDIDSKTITSPTKEVWQGAGTLPVVMVRKGWNFDSTDTYLGIKGGLCNTWETSATSHSHMDAGSFVFEAEGVRWSDDVVRPAYGDWHDALSAAGSRAGDTSQGGLRWDTFRVNNLCHSTIVSYSNDGSVNGKLHSSDYYVDGFASIDNVIDADGRQGAVVNMTQPMKGQVQRAIRTVELVNGTDLVVTDEITALPSLDSRLEWRMLSMTSASVSQDGVTLTRDGKTRMLSVISDNSSVTPEYKTWTAAKPATGTDGWGVLNFKQSLSSRVIAGWTVTVPAGQTVRFVTTLSSSR